MDIESVDQAHDSERAAEHSQANMGDQDTLTAGEGEEGAVAARVGEQEGRSDQGEYCIVLCESCSGVCRLPLQTFPLRSPRFETN